MAVCYKSVLAGGGSGAGIHVDTLTITTQPSTKTYMQGDTIDTTGMVVTASASGMSGTVTQYCTVAPQVLDTVGTQVVTVSYGDATATFNVTVEEIVSLSITSQPTKTEYIQGETLDLTGMEVTATSANLSRNVTNVCTYVPANGSTLSTTGTITVTASLNGVSDTTTVNSYAVTSIEITTPPAKVSYSIGDQLDLRGIVVTAIAGNLTKDVTILCTFNPTNGTVLDTDGTFTLTVSWDGLVDTLQYYVAPSISLESATWEFIQSIGAQGNGSQYWSVGDTKTITLNGTVGTKEFNNYQCKVFIIEFNYRGDNGIYFQGFKSTDATPVDIAICDGNYESKLYDGTKAFSMNHWGDISTSYHNSKNYGGWKGCDLRYDILGSVEIAPSGYGSIPTTSRVGYDATAIAKTSPVSNTLMAALPNDLRSVLAPWTLYTDNIGNRNANPDAITTSIDYLPLLAEYEVTGNRSYANQYEYVNDKQKQMTYYANGNSQIKYSDLDKSTAIRYWCRSTCVSLDISFCLVSSLGSPTYGTSNNSFGLSPAFKVA